MKLQIIVKIILKNNSVKRKKHVIKHCYVNILDANGNPVTQIVQSVGVTDASGNPITGKLYKIVRIFIIYLINLDKYKF